MGYIKDKFLELQDLKKSNETENFQKLLKIRTEDFQLFSNEYTDIIQNLRDAGFLFTIEIIEETLTEASIQYYTKIIIENSDSSSSTYFVIKHDENNKKLQWKSENDLVDTDVVDDDYDYNKNNEQKLIYELITVFPELLV